jgi:hypothetical protein
VFALTFNNSAIFHEKFYEFRIILRKAAIISKIPKHQLIFIIETRCFFIERITEISAEDGCSTFLRNAGIYLQVHMAFVLFEHHKLILTRTLMKTNNSYYIY